MPNHFHILIKQEIEGGITKFMKKISTAYSMFFNIKYDRQGSLFSGRFKSKLVGSDDIYLKYLFAYIHMNPLSIGFSNWENEIMTDNQKMKNFLLSYKYSSYQDYLGVNRVEKVILNKEVFPDYFQVGESFEDFIQKYQGFYLGKA
jgi:putative transposase